MKDNIPFLGVEYLNLFWIASPIQRINPISSTIMAGSRDSKRFFCKGSLILDLSNTLEKELGREIYQTSLCTKPLSTIQCNKTLGQDQLVLYYSFYTTHGYRSINSDVAVISR